MERRQRKRPPGGRAGVQSTATLCACSRVALKVTPGARVELLEISAGRLHAKVRAKPKDGEANEAVLAMIAAALGLPRSRIILLRGATSREKLVRLA